VSCGLGRRREAQETRAVCAMFKATPGWVLGLARVVCHVRLCGVASAELSSW
jgi:hypothetical protein